MLAIQKPKEIIDPYDWLPPYGETRVDVRTGEGLVLDADIFYQPNFGDAEVIKKRTIRFTGLRTFSFGSTNNPSREAFDYGDRETFKKMLSSLVEYEYSEAAQKVQKTLPWRGHIRHFEIFFVKANQSLIVFAEDCQLMPEVE